MGRRPAGPLTRVRLGLTPPKGRALTAPTDMLRCIWKSFCALAGALLVGALAYTYTPLGVPGFIVGAVIGLPVGWVFGRHIGPIEFLAG